MGTVTLRRTSVRARVVVQEVFMPVLASETALYPEGLLGEPFLEDSPTTSHSQRCWWVMHVKPRQEKSLARQLLAGQVPYYLPLVAHRFRSRDRILTSQVPLFPSYVFVLGSREERLKALTTNRIVRALEVGDQSRLWHDLRQIRALVESGAPITPEERLAPGDLVQITSGALTGLCGKILRTASGRRFVVQVDFIQRGASVVLDDFVLTEARGGS